jgi:hypothetical protein
MASPNLDNKGIAADVQPTDSSQGTAEKVFDDGVSHVPEKYRGTNADQHDMAVLGKKQVLRVRNSLRSHYGQC